MSVFNSVGSPLVFLMVILMIAGSVFGMAVSGADFFNPATSSAEANRMNTETDHQQAIFEQTERLTEAQTNAQIEALQRDQEIAEQQAQLSLDFTQRFNELKLTILDKIAQILSNLVWVVGIVVSSGFILALAFFLVPKAIIAVRSAVPQQPKPADTLQQGMPLGVDPWKSKEFRKRMIKHARENEMATRQAKFNQQQIHAFYDPATMTHDQWNKLPWAN